MKTFIKDIKAATSKEQLSNITYAALKSNLSSKQYDKVIAYAVCREIELGIWEHLHAYPNKEAALKEAQKAYKIKY